LVPGDGLPTSKKKGLHASWAEDHDASPWNVAEISSRVDNVSGDMDGLTRDES
jgi:hypothetical protein